MSIKAQMDEQMVRTNEKPCSSHAIHVECNMMPLFQQIQNEAIHSGIFYRTISNCCGCLRYSG